MPIAKIFVPAIFDKLQIFFIGDRLGSDPEIAQIDLMPRQLIVKTKTIPPISDLIDARGYG